MFNPQLHNKTAKLSKQKDVVFDYITTLSFVGLGVSGGYILEDSFKEGVASTPTIKIIDTTPKTVYFDYNVSQTSTYNTTTNTGKLEAARDLLNVENIKNNASSFFENFSAGDTFTVENSSYNYDEHDLDGIYVFQGASNNLMVATISGLTGLPEQVYSSSLFDDVPIITSNLDKLITSDINKCILTNNIPALSNSFVAAGVGVGSILEFGDVKYRVETIKIKANSEVLELSIPDSIETISLPLVSLTSKTLINVYKKN